MRLTDAVIVDRDFRRLNAARTLSERIQRRLAYYRKACPGRLSYVHLARAETVLSVLSNDQNWPKTLGEITSVSLQLDNREIKSPTNRVANSGVVSVKRVLEYVFADLPEPERTNRSDYLQELLETLEQEARTSRASGYKFLIQCEVALRAVQGHFMVFNTLTVDSNSYTKVFAKDSKVFKEYIRALDKKLTEHSYFAVIEEGAQHGRMHIHVLHCFKDLPREAVDPNVGRGYPNQRQIDWFRGYWKYGFSTPIAVRYSPNDAYGKLNWRWPIDKKTNMPLKVGSPLRLSSYLSKYINKSYQSKKRSELLWRIRKKQRFGTAILTELTSSLSRETLVIAASKTIPTIKLGWNKIPNLQIRLESLRELQKRNHCQDLKKVSSRSTVTTLAKLLRPRQSIVQSPRDLTRTIQENNQQSTGFLMMLDIDDTATFERAVKELQKAAGEINERYFRTSTRQWGTTSTRDHIY